MSEPNNSAWPFTEITESEGFDIDKIFGTGNGAAQADSFASPAPVSAAEPAPAPVAQEVPAAPIAEPTPALTAVTAAPEAKAPAPAKAAAEAPAENPIAAAFEQKTAENTKVGLLEKPPVFYHKGIKEDIEDASMTFEELRIRKSDDFTDLEEGKRVSWSVEYCGIRKEVKDPKGTTIISMKEMIERSREFLEALKKTKDKNPCCYVKPKVEMKTKGKVKQEFFAYVPKQTVCKVEIEANLHDCPYDDGERYIFYADIHSHNSMDAFFSAKDDSDERSTGLYFVLGKLDQFYPDIKARIFCGDTFVPVDPNTVIEGLEQQFPAEWLDQVTIQKKKGARFEKDRDKKRGFFDMLAEVGL